MIITQEKYRNAYQLVQLYFSHRAVVPSTDEGLSEEDKKVRLLYFTSVDIMKQYLAQEETPAKESSPS